MNFQYPIFLDLTGKKCLIIGDHPEIPSKLETLRSLGASAEWKLTFDPFDLSGCFLVIASLPGNSEIFRLCEDRNILCNAIDDPEHCRFSFGALHRDGDLTIAISTNGVAPALAVRLRERIERDFGPEYGDLLALLSELRPEIRSRVADFNARRDLWYRIVDSDALQLLRAGQRDAALRSIRQTIDQAANNTSRSDTSAPAGGR